MIYDNVPGSRLELPVEDGTAFIDYRIRNQVATLLHAEVPAQLAGRGLGSQLVRESLNSLRARGLKVVPVCGFIAAYIGRHPEYQSMLADSVASSSA